MSSPISLLIEDEQLKELDKIASELDRSRAWVILDAIAQYVDHYQWQLDEIEKGIVDADAGRVYTDEQVAEHFARKKNSRNRLAG